MEARSRSGMPAMKPYETSATVDDHGEVRVAGVPYAPGTEVEVTISPKVMPDQALIEMDDQILAASRARMQELFQSIKGFRMAPKFSRDAIDTRTESE